MSTMSKPSFVYVIYIATTAEKLWTALTEGKFSREYWAGRQVESDWKPGSPIVFRRLDGAPDVVLAKVIDVKPQRHLSMSWTYRIEPGKEALPASRVTYDLQPAGPVNMKLTVIHEEFEPGSVVDDGVRD